MSNRRRRDLAAEPWWQDITPGPVGSETRRRWARASRLSQFVVDLRRRPRLMMTEPMLRYRRQCLDRWRDYLDGWAPPLPDRDNGRPSKLP